MDHKKRTARHDWRSKLTAQESLIVTAAEVAAELYGAKKSEALAIISPIRNRAIQRCRYKEQSA